MLRAGQRNYNPTLRGKLRSLSSKAMNFEDPLYNNNSSHKLVYICDSCKKNVDPENHKEHIRTMPCFHTICNNCILGVCDKIDPACPKCGEEWDLLELRRFTCCNLCKYYRKQAVTRCRDCTVDLCADCEKHHRESKYSINHRYESINQDFANALNAKIKEAGLKDRDPRQRATAKNNSMMSRRDYHDRTSELNMPGITCTSKLELDTSNMFALAEDKQAMADLMVEDTANQLSLFQDVLSANPQLKADMAANMKDYVEAGLEQVQYAMSQSSWDTSSQYEIWVQGRPLDPKSKPEVHLKMQSSAHLNFKDVLSIKWRLKSTTPVEGNARRVYKCHSRVLVSTWDAFLLHTLECEPLGHTGWSKAFEASAAVTISLNIWMLSDMEKGLFMVNRAGQVMQRLSPGCFSDVDAYDDRVYGLEYKRKLVKIYHYDAAKQQWVLLQDVALKYDNVSSGDTVRAYDQRLYVASALNHCVYAYNLQSSKFRQVGKHGNVAVSSEPGILFYPRICMADYFGNCLVADSWNKRLLVLHDDDEWGRVDLGEQEGEIWDIFLEHNLSNLWAISFIDGEYKLLHFVH